MYLSLKPALVQAEEEPEAKLGEGLASVPGQIGTLGKKLISGARSAISRIPIIGKYASSDKNTAGGDDANAEAPEEETTTPASGDEEQVESPEESASTSEGEEAPKEEAPKEDAPAEEAPKEENGAEEEAKKE